MGMIGYKNKWVCGEIRSARDLVPSDNIPHNIDEASATKYPHIFGLV